MIIKNLDAWDKREFDECVHEDYEVQRIERTGSHKVHNYAEFMRDVFGGLYKFNPEARPEEEAPASERWADKIYGEVSQLKEWKTLRERTRMNPESAAAATVDFCQQFMDAVPQQENPGKKEAIDPDEIDMSEVRRAARAACESATEVADETNEALAAFGYGNGNGRPQYASPTEKRDIARRLKDNQHVKMVAELAGRMRRIALEKQKQKTKHGVDELADIKVGDDLARLVPAELAKLAHPLLKLDFQKRFLEKQLLQYELRGNERKGRGPLVVCVDESSSMRGNRDVWSKAVTMALLQVAQQQKRKFALVHFSGSVSRIDRFEKKVHPVELMDAIAHFTGGGTDFEDPLNAAAAIISDEKEYNKADIILITDDECSISDNWLKKFMLDKKEFGFNVISICIDAKSSVCQSFSNKTITVHDIIGDSEALEHMFTV